MQLSSTPAPLVPRLIRKQAAFITADSFIIKNVDGGENLLSLGEVNSTDEIKARQKVKSVALLTECNFIFISFAFMPQLF